MSDAQAELDDVRREFENPSRLCHCPGDCLKPPYKCILETAVPARDLDEAVAWRVRDLRLVWRQPERADALEALYAAS